jgi:hypothetical protein
VIDTTPTEPALGAELHRTVGRLPSAAEVALSGGERPGVAAAERDRSRGGLRRGGIEVRHGSRASGLSAHENRRRAATDAERGGADIQGRIVAPREHDARIAGVFEYLLVLWWRPRPHRLYILDDPCRGGLRGVPRAGPGLKRAQDAPPRLQAGLHVVVAGVRRARWIDRSAIAALGVLVPVVAGRLGLIQLGRVQPLRVPGLALPHGKQPVNIAVQQKNERVSE